MQDIYAVLGLILASLIIGYWMGLTNGVKGGYRSR